MGGVASHVIAACKAQPARELIELRRHFNALSQSGVGLDRVSMDYMLDPLTSPLLVKEMELLKCVAAEERRVTAARAQANSYSNRGFWYIHATAETTCGSGWSGG